MYVTRIAIVLTKVVLGGAVGKMFGRQCARYKGEILWEVSGSNLQGQAKYISYLSCVFYQCKVMRIL